MSRDDLWQCRNDTPVLVLAAHEHTVDGKNAFIHAMLLTDRVWSADEYMALACCKGRFITPLLHNAVYTLRELLQKMSLPFARLLLHAEPQCLEDCRVEGATIVLDMVARVGLDACAFVDEKTFLTWFSQRRPGRNFAVLWPLLPETFLETVSLDTLWRVVVCVLSYDGVDGIILLERYLSASRRAALLRHRLDFTAPTDESNDVKLASVVHVAVSLNNMRVMERFCDVWREPGDTNLLLQDAVGRTPLMLASRCLPSSNVLAVIQSARRFGDVHAMDSHGATALMYAAVGNFSYVFAPHNRLLFVRLLLQDDPRGLRARDSQNRTLMMWAAARAYPDVMAYLLQICSNEKALFQDVDVYGHCALWFAAAAANYAALHALLPVYLDLGLHACIKDVVTLLAKQTTCGVADSLYIWPSHASFQCTHLNEDGDCCDPEPKDVLHQRYIWLWETMKNRQAVIAPQAFTDEFCFVTLLLGTTAFKHADSLPCCVTLSAHWFDAMASESESTQQAFIAACHDKNNDMAHSLLHGRLESPERVRDIMCFPESCAWMTGSAGVVLLKWQCCKLRMDSLKTPRSRALLLACLALSGACEARAYIGTFAASSTMVMPIRLYKRLPVHKSTQRALFVTCVHIDSTCISSVERCADVIHSVVHILKDEAWQLQDSFHAAAASQTMPLQLDSLVTHLDESAWRRAHMSVQGLRVMPCSKAVIVCIAASRRLYDKSLLAAQTITRLMGLKVDTSKPPVSFINK